MTQDNYLRNLGICALGISYPCNHGWINHWDVPRWGGGCHFDTGILPSIGNVMRSVGYETAVAGKWQISDFRVEPEACLKAGFKEYCMWTGGEGGNIEKRTTS